MGTKFSYPVVQIRDWIPEGKTQAWIGAQIGVNPKLIYKVCKKHGIKCQRTGPRSGEGHPEWKGGRLIDEDGYVLVYTPNQDKREERAAEGRKEARAEDRKGSEREEKRIEKLQKAGRAARKKERKGN